METDYRKILWKQLRKKRSINPRYSLRAMARRLQITPSRLSQILRGKQGLSVEWARQIASRLGMTESETALFCAMVEASDSRSKTRRKEASSQLKKLQVKDSGFKVVPEDVFQLVSAWYHWAILELTRLKDFCPSPAWIASKLGLSPEEAEGALARLERTGLIHRDKNGFTLTNSSLSTTAEIPSEAIRTFNSQILLKAEKAIWSQPVEERDFSTLTVAIKRDRIPEIKERIAAFRRELNAELEQDTIQNDGEEVYCLGIQFFNLTKLVHKNGDQNH